MVDKLTLPAKENAVQLKINDIIDNSANKDLSNLSSTGNAKFQAPLVSGTNIKTINDTSILGSGNIDIDSLPDQSGQSCKFLTTNGTSASWAEIPAVSGDSADVEAGRNIDIYERYSKASVTSVQQVSNLIPASDHRWVGLIYDGTEYTVIDNKCYASHSEDGINWSQPSLYIDDSDPSIGYHHDAIQGMVYSNNRYVVLGYSYSYTRSSITAGWSSTELDDEFDKIAYGNGKFIIAHLNPSGIGYYSTSTDGSTWSDSVGFDLPEIIGNAGSVGYISNLICDGNRYMITGVAKSGIGIMSTADFEHWNAEEPIGSAYVGCSNFLTITSDGSIYTSQLGGNPWIALDVDGNLGTHYWKLFCKGEGDSFLALDNSGYVALLELSKKKKNISSNQVSIDWYSEGCKSSILNKPIPGANVRFDTILTGGVITSKKQVLNTNQGCSCLAFNGDKFVSLVYETRSGALSAYYSSTSKDGYTWSELHRLPSFSGNLTDMICYNNSFLVLTSKGEMYVSTDGEHWAPQANPIRAYFENVLEEYDNYCHSFTYDGTRLLVLAYGNRLFSFTDGQGWEELENISESAQSESAWDKIFWDGSRYIVSQGLGQYSTAIMTSLDLENWVEQNPAPYSGIFTTVGTCSLILSQSGHIYHSTLDGSNWSELTLSDSLGSNNWFNICYGDNKLIISTNSSLSRYMAVINLQGRNVISANANNSQITLKQGGVTKGDFTLDQSEDEVINLDPGVSKDLEGDGIIITEPTPSSWTQEVLDPNLEVDYHDTAGYGAWVDVAYNGSTYVVLSERGGISTSSDGTNWTQPVQSSSLYGVSESWKSIVYDGTEFIAMSSKNYVSTSIDGSSWSEPSEVSYSFSEGYLGDLVYDGDVLVITYSEIGYTYLSEDGVDWSGQSTNFTPSNAALASDGNNHIVALTPDGYISTASSYEDTSGYKINGWTSPVQVANLVTDDQGNTCEWHSISYNGEKFVALGIPTSDTNNYMVTSTSTNGVTWTPASKVNYNVSRRDWNAFTCTGISSYIAISAGGYVTKYVGGSDSTSISVSSSYTAHSAMPSNTFTNLTLGASGTTYTAPADGWVIWNWWTTASPTSYMHLVNNRTAVGILLVPNQGFAYQQRCYIPVAKGDVFSIAYNNLEAASGTHEKYLRFVYAIGSESEA